MRRPTTLARTPDALRFAAAALAAFQLAACASSGSAASAATQETGRTVVGSSSVGTPDTELYKDRRASRVDVAAPPAAVWAALPGAFASVGLEGAGPAIGRERTLAAQPRLRRTLGKVPLSRFIDCGRMSTGELSADNHIVRLTVTSAVTPQGTGSALATQVTATAAAVDNSNAPVECSSTGVLEARIGDAVTTNLK
jgi:hypothetical protein